MTRLPRHLAPPKVCTSCGERPALPHRTLCLPCRTDFLAEHKRLHVNAKRIRSEKQRHAKALRDKDRARPENFKASSAAIKRQIAWMDANNLLPDQRRHDYDKDKADAGRAARRP